MSKRRSARLKGNETTFSEEEVAKHKSDSDLWLTIDGNVYDLTSFLAKHPGGPAPKVFGGRDATEIFHRIHKPESLGRYKHLKVGTLRDYTPTGAVTPAAAPTGRSSSYYNVEKDEDGYDLHTDADKDEREFGDLMAQEGETSHLSAIVLLMYSALLGHSALAAWVTGCSIWAMAG